MNILFFQTGINPNDGGVQRVSFRIAQMLKERMSQNCYCAYFDLLSKVPEQNPFDKIFFKSISDTDFWVNLTGFIKLNKIDTIINQHGGNSSITENLAKIKTKTGCRLFSFLHISPNASREVLGYRDWRFPKLVIRSILKEIVIKIYHFDRIGQRKLYDLSDKVILLSESAIPYYLNNIGLSESDKVIAISNPVSFDWDPEEEIKKYKKKQFLVVSRMGDAIKKISTILYTWETIYETLPDWHLYIVGDGPDLRKYKQIAARLGLKNIHFEGQQDPRPYYKESAIFLMTSSTEGLPMTLLEAQQYGVVPIVMDSFCALHDIVKDGVNGYIVPKRDVTSFIAKTLVLGRDRTLLDRLSNSAMKSVQNFSLENIYHKWLDLLHN